MDLVSARGHLPRVYFPFSSFTRGGAEWRGGDGDGGAEEGGGGTGEGGRVAEEQIRSQTSRVKCSSFGGS